MSTWQNIKDDLQDSWHFRIWALFWLICGSIILAGFVAFSQNQIVNSGDQSVRVLNATSMTFPAFRIRFTDRKSISEIDYSRSFCTTPDGNANLTASQCTPLNKQCLKVNSNTVTVQNTNLGNLPINCDIITSGLNPEFMTFEIDSIDQNSYGYGIDEYGVSVPPTLNSMITLEKSSFNGNDLWDARIQNINFNSNPGGLKGTYIFSVWIATFKVVRYESQNSAEVAAVFGQTAALLGGFIYFMYGIHTILMGVALIFIKQDSRTLGDGTGHANMDNDRVSNSYNDRINDDKVYASSHQNDTPIY